MPRRNRKAVKENEASPNGSAAGCRLQRVIITPAADFYRNLSHFFLPFSISSAGNKHAFFKKTRASAFRLMHGTQGQYISLKIPCQFLMGGVD